MAQAHFRCLRLIYIRESSRSKGDLSVFCSLSEEARRELVWWRDEFALFNSKPFSPIEPDLVIFSDSSLYGWGASCNSVTARGPWTDGEKGKHINELELMAAFNAVRSFAPLSIGISIRIFIDNSTAVSYVNRAGGTHSRSCSRVAQDLVLWCESRDIRIEAVFIPGELNTVADAESRTLNDSSDWSLCPDVFSLISDLWTVEIDLFASSWNAELPVFCSWQPQPLSL